MTGLIDKYLRKLRAQGLARAEDPVFMALDDKPVSNRPLEGGVKELCRIFDLMNIYSFLYAVPAWPYRAIINELLSHPRIFGIDDKVVPRDCETRTFFHDIPVMDALTPEAASAALSRRKSALVRGGGIVTYGTVTPEQAFVSFSSASFSLFVKYFSDSLQYLRQNAVNGTMPGGSFLDGFKALLYGFFPGYLSQKKLPAFASSPGPEEQVLSALCEAGRAVVRYGLVDSYFGNISYTTGKTMHISQTGSSLDELEDCIDPVPMDGSSSAGITASSELSAHKNIFLKTGHNAILHGHPKFSVIMSMVCAEECEDEGDCHRDCPRKRFICGVPVVPGEIGTGPSGLARTVPEAMAQGGAAVVYGHGVFTSGAEGFGEPFRKLLETERDCAGEYFKTARNMLGLFERGWKL